VIDPARRRQLVLEGGLFLVSLAIAFLGGRSAEHAFASRIASLGAAVLPATDAVASEASRARMLFAFGVGILAVGRAVSLGRGREPIRIPWLLPATVTLAALALVVHQASVDTVVRVVDGVRTTHVGMPSSASYAEGFLLGSLAAFFVLVSPFDPATIAVRATAVLATAVAAIFVALAVFGSGPSGSGTRINLGPLQPIEAVKPLFVLFLAAYLGTRASKLRWQRRRFLGFAWPRPTLLVPALIGLVGLFAGLYVVGDLGPMSILAFVFLGMFYVVTRAGGFVVVAIAAISSLVALAVAHPELISVGRVVTRVRMWRAPFTNAIAYGDQLGESLWAIAAGGPFGQGLAEGDVPLVPAGKTDLVLATLAEQLGALSVIGYIAGIATLVLTSCYVASRTRTPERALLAVGVALLVLAQWAIIHGGTFGTLPLTGIVVPFLSFGKSSLVAFLVLVAIVVRVAEDGGERVASTDLDELRGGVRWVAIVAVFVFAHGAYAVARVSIVDRHRITASAIATRLGDGRVVLRSNPRLTALARSLVRGTIADRHGVSLAETDADTGRRRFPLGRDLGTLLGAFPSRVQLRPFALERALDARLRGYREAEHGAERRVGPDLTAFVPLLDLEPAARRRAVARLRADVASRSVRLTLDSRLQQRSAAILRRHLASEGRLAIAAAIVDVDSGQVLARVQVPDLDPNDVSWQERLLRGDSSFVPRFTGAYGEWPDKTGVQGFFQAGSVGKVFTALAAARHGYSSAGSACSATTGIAFDCTQRDDVGPFFTRPGWSSPVHDHSSDPTHGRLDLPRALGESCNVYFGQLALSLGPRPFIELRDAGVEVGIRARLDPGAAGSRDLASTGFGQGAMAMNVMQAARLVAAVGGAGRYRRCPSTMVLDASCTESVVVADERTLEPILAGMRRVMVDGTGRRLDEPEGLRMYGKTGTADAVGFAGEDTFGIARNRTASPHSWFVALAEPSAAPECSVHVPGRIAIAVVVPRGGSGASAAGPIAMELAAVAHELGLVGAH